jgi:hypothetical protein
LPISHLCGGVERPGAINLNAYCPWVRPGPEAGAVADDILNAAHAVHHCLSIELLAYPW